MIPVPVLVLVKPFVVVALEFEGKLVGLVLLLVLAPVARLPVEASRSEAELVVLMLVSMA